MSTNIIAHHQSAVAALHRLFAGTPEPATRPIQDIYLAAGRGSDDPDKNKRWLHVLLQRYLKAYGLAEPIRGERQVIQAVRLTPKGEAVLRTTSDPRTVRVPSKKRSHKRVTTTPKATRSPRAVLQHTESPDSAPPSRRSLGEGKVVTIDSILRDILVLRQQHPYLQIDLKITGKAGDPPAR